MRRTLTFQSFLRICQCLFNRGSHWCQDVDDLLEMLILSLTREQSSERPISGNHSLTGIEPHLICESCRHHYFSLQTLAENEVVQLLHHPVRLWIRLNSNRIHLLYTTVVASCMPVLPYRRDGAIVLAEIAQTHTPANNIPLINRQKSVHVLSPLLVGTKHSSLERERARQKSIYLNPRLQSWRK
jgi:hypothetical protein